MAQSSLFFCDYDATIDSWQYATSKLKLQSKSLFAVPDSQRVQPPARRMVARGATSARKRKSAGATAAQAVAPAAADPAGAATIERDATGRKAEGRAASPTARTSPSFPPLTTPPETTSVNSPLSRSPAGNLPGSCSTTLSLTSSGPLCSAKGTLCTSSLWMSGSGT
jgi:hypothetical protein